MQKAKIIISDLNVESMIYELSVSELALIQGGGEVSDLLTWIDDHWEEFKQGVSDGWNKK
ncbi:hypothetical protein LC608_29185 [Nostoc sp. XA010]|uniref:hypothetical protein n=1 Tax=Nostoc sp. XA010 TaxID=2780407 RepID=UPI001E32A013|nr:hypothetical protein [Nostoc sp. XA010]MCC5660974.1 hypothetical protein [Nostoc sp. XA010]